jgi:hypothetical protein
MAIPSTGPISMSTIQTEFGGSNPISLSEYYRSNTYEAAVSGNNTTVPQSGTIKMSQFRGTFQARYIVWKLLGAGGGGGYGVFKTVALAVVTVPFIIISLVLLVRTQIQAKAILRTLVHLAAKARSKRMARLAQALRLGDLVLAVITQINMIALVTRARAV